MGTKHVSMKVGDEINIGGAVFQLKRVAGTNTIKAVIVAPEGVQLGRVEKTAETSPPQQETGKRLGERPAG